ncbi:prohibitin [Pseudoscourfieldia marina]
MASPGGPAAQAAAAALANALGVVARWSVGLGIAGSVAQASLFDVDGGERAVMFNRLSGVSQKVVGEGTHIMIPWFQTPHKFDIRTRPRLINTVTGTKDLQNVNLTLRVLCRPEVDKLPNIYQTLGKDYDERVLPSIGNEVLKSVIARFNADELLTKRAEVSLQVSQELLKRSEGFNLVLEDVAITHLTFGQEFAKAIEAKQVAEQDALRSNYIVAKAEQEKLAAVIRAEGEAEAANLISNATRRAGTALVELRKIEAAREIAETMARSGNVAYLPSGGNVLLNLAGGGGAR